MQKVQEIIATFKGEDGSMGFRTGEEYKLWYMERRNKIYISRRSKYAIAIPYDTEIGFKKNWKVTKLENLQII